MDNRRVDMIFKENLKGIALLISEIKSVREKKGLVTAVTSLFYLDTARPPLSPYDVTLRTSVLV